MNVRKKYFNRHADSCKYCILQNHLLLKFPLLLQVLLKLGILPEYPGCSAVYTYTGNICGYNTDGTYKVNWSQYNLKSSKDTLGCDLTKVKFFAPCGESPHSGLPDRFYDKYFVQ